MVIDGSLCIVLSIVRTYLSGIDKEQAIFVGSVTKSGKMKEKNLMERIISFNFNKLEDQPIGIKLATQYKGVKPLLCFDTLLI